jgi:uncharacterized LabA/DUF88 family protein
MHTYIDGESHFIRSEQCISQVFGEKVTMESLLGMVPKDFGIAVDRRCKLFWLSMYDRRISLGGKNKLVYFTSCAGDEDLLHALRVSLRAKGFEPRLGKEASMLAKQRDHVLNTEGLIEKPKGIDIALTVRMMEDAQKNAFDECCLFTSDIDYIPLIEAVQRMGKTVAVYGYSNGLGKNSQMLYVPDVFCDLTVEIEHVKESMLARRGAT